MVNKSNKITAENYDEIRRYVINHGSQHAILKYGFSSNYASWIGQSATYEDFMALKRSKYKQYQDKYNQKHSNKSMNDVGNRIHFSPQLPLSSPFNNTTKRHSEQDIKTVNNAPTSVFRDTREFSAYELKKICEGAARGAFIKEIVESVGISSIGKFYLMLDADDYAKEVFYKFFTQGEAKRKERALEKQLNSYKQNKNKRAIERADMVKKKNRSNAQKAYWDGLSDQEREERLESMRLSRERSRAKRKMLQEGGGSVGTVKEKSTEAIKEEVVKEAQSTDVQAPAETATVQREVVSYKINLSPQPNEGDLLGSIEVHHSEKRSRRFFGFALSALFMSGVLALMKVFGLLDIAWTTVTFPMTVELVGELVMIFALGLSLAVKVWKLPSHVKLVYKDYKNKED